MKKRGASVALAAGGGALVIAVALCAFRAEVAELVHELRTGYRFEWMPDGVIAGDCEKHALNCSGLTAVNRFERVDRRHGGVWAVGAREIRFLPAPSGGASLFCASAINEQGDVVGTEEDDDLAPAIIPGFLLSFQPTTALGVRAWFWPVQGGPIEIPSLGGQIWPSDLNGRRQVVGSGGSPWNLWRGFIWELGSSTRELGALSPDEENYATAINEAGTVVGNRAPAGGESRPFIWTPEKGMTDLGVPSGFIAGFAKDVNDRGEVVLDLVALKTIRPFLWREAIGFTALPAPEGYLEVEAHALNNQGTVLLSARQPPRREYAGFLVLNGKLRRLPPAPKGIATYYLGLNDRGWLTGWVRLEKSEDRVFKAGFLAVPRR